MSLSINKVMLGGNLTRDPQIKFLANEQAVANFGLAINEKYKGKDGEKKETVTFVDVEAWGRTAELVGQYLVKGSACFIEGRLKLDSWEDKDGQKRSKIKVVADSVQFIGIGKRSDEEREPSDVRLAETAKPSQATAPAPTHSEEPPF